MGIWLAPSKQITDCPPQVGGPFAAQHDDGGHPSSTHPAPYATPTAAFLPEASASSLEGLVPVAETSPSYIITRLSLKVPAGLPLHACYAGLPFMWQ